MLIYNNVVNQSMTDQAAGLRRMANQKPVQVIAVASGKGGVGKTNVSVNLSLGLIALGKDVILLDADLGLANVDLLLGLHSETNLSHVVSGERTLEEVIIEGPEGLKIIPASSGTQMMTELSPAQHAGVIRAFSELNTPVDVLVVDTAAGISDGVVSFVRASNEVIVVVCDEPTSLTDAYALIKVLSTEHNVQKFNILANMVRTPKEGLSLFSKLSRATDHYLDVTLDYLGAIPYDEYLVKAVKKQRAVMQSYPQSPAALSFRNLAKKVDGWSLPDTASGHLEFFVERLIQYSAAG
ncbi:MAG: MinD/ParA family protein [Gammaproteobacteria bacterium]|nr:MinD/ParA family protein [Gammaproteobacteria bacterium]MCW8911675.1 MinD/ParA family protein [Gammaproteobacteria bacterium]MCW9003933.1 MinD/ParA family protein [Gammaproteobacteria bacterium]MCW9056923.1 MinD/ParA family protein [Gammaproteobacteria bacterium]